MKFNYTKWIPPFILIMLSYVVALSIDYIELTEQNDFNRTKAKDINFSISNAFILFYTLKKA